MGKKKNGPKLKGFEKVLATLPEYEGFRRQPDYDILCDQDPILLNFLELLFSLLKRFGTASPAEKSRFSSLLSPALYQNTKQRDMYYQDMMADEFYEVDDASQMTFYVCAVYQQLVNEGFGTPAQQIAIKQRYELLLDFLFPNQRKFGEQFLANSLKPQEITKETVGDFDEHATVSDIFNHLMFALRNDLSHIAHEIVGGLRYMKKEFPKGDPEFLYALVYMKDNSPDSLQRAISYLERIPKSNRNYKSVQNMKAEAHARLGDLAYFKQTAMAATNHISELSMRGYLQLLVNHIDLDAVDDAHLDQVFHAFYQRYNTGPDLLNNDTPENLHSIPMQLCKENVLRAVKELYGFNTQVVGVEQIEQKGQDVPASVLRAQLLLRLSARDVLNDLTALLKDNTGDHRYDFVKHWFPVYADADGTVSSRKINTLLEASRTIARDEDFVDAFMADYKYIVKADGLDLEYWLAEACRAATACNHPDLDLLWHRLKEVCPDSDAIYGQDRTYQKVYGYLRGHEQLLYAAAESGYQKAKKESAEQGWKDCGMISLSFFRVLEVELRDHIFVKAFGSAENRNVIDDFCSKLKPYVLAIDLKSQTGEDVSEERKMIRAKCGSKNKFDFPRTVEALRKPQNMELGPMWYALRFLEDKCRVEKEWQPYQQALRQMVYDVLSEDGIEAIQDGTIEKAISEKLREEYRNPPAHARYLPFSKACECRDHVNETLLKLHTQWLKKSE